MEQYTMRSLSGQDLFPMIKILSRVKAKDMILNLFKKREESRKELEKKQKEFLEIANKEAMEKGEGESEVKTIDEDREKEIGMELFADVIETIMCNLNLAKEDINNLLANLCSVKVEEIQSLDMLQYTNLLMEFLGKEELKDFFNCIFSSNVFKSLK